MSDIRRYTDDVQELFVRFLLSDANLFVRCQAITKAQYFDSKYRPAVNLILSHSETYGKLPTVDQVNAISDTKIEEMDNIHDEHKSWFMDEYEMFCKHKALAKAVVDSSEFLETQDYGQIEKIISEASQVGLVKDLGLSYFEDPRGRLEWIKNQGGATSTGWKGIDSKLYGGFNRGELSLFAGGPGSGKSLFLQNLALNWVFMGFNVVYISLELSEQLISMRLDAMVTGIATRDVMRNIDDVELKVKMRAKDAGNLIVKQMPSGININDIRAFIREYELEQGLKIDCILIDYLDLMFPLSAKISAENTFIKDKFVTEEMRNYAREGNFLMASASQLNRGAVEEIEFDHSHIAGGISKINTCDNLMGIFTSNAMRERGRYQLQFMKTRSSSGVGQKVDLKFDPDTLLIVDLEEGDEDAMTSQSASLLTKIKRGGSLPEREPEPEDAVKSGMELMDFLKKKK